MIGSAVVPYLASQGHEVIRLVRHEAGDGEVFWDPDAGKIDAAGLEGFDGVVNLATMQWPARWTASAKQKIRANRLATNGLLAENLAKCNKKPKILICSSGMGIYPSCGDQVITEDSALGSDFLATLQRDGEAAAMKASVSRYSGGYSAYACSTRRRGNSAQYGPHRRWKTVVTLDQPG